MTAAMRAAGQQPAARKARIAGAARIAGGAVALAALAAALARLPLAQAAALVIGPLAALILLRRPWLIWPALAALLPFAAAQKLAGPASALDLLLAAALALWFADGVRRARAGGPGPQTAPSGVALAALIYAGVLALAALGAADLPEAAAEVVKWAGFAAVLIVLPPMLRGGQAAGPQAGQAVGPQAGQAVGPDGARGRVRWVAAAAVAGAAAQAALGLYQFVFRIGPEWFAIGAFMRASGSFSQPNPYAGYLGLALPVAASLALQGLRRPREMGLLWTAWWCGAALLIAAGLLASWSRGGWIGAASALAVVLILFALGTRRRAALVVALLALGASLLPALSLAPALAPEPLRARLAELPAFFGAGDPLRQEVTDENFAIVERLAHWEAAQRMFAAEPWLGVGPGNYAAAYPAYRLPVWEEALGHAHNVYLNVLAESGLVGMAAFLALWAAAGVAVARSLRRARRAGDAFAAALAIGAAGVLAHLAVHSLVDNLFVQGMYLVVAVWLALATVE